jgi:hypothetical protein
LTGIVQVGGGKEEKTEDFWQLPAGILIPKHKDDEFTYSRWMSMLR